MMRRASIGIALLAVSHFAFANVSSALAQAGSTGCTTGKQDKSISGGEDAKDNMPTWASAPGTQLQDEERATFVTENSETIFNSPRGVTLGNGNGDVSFVEFFDYNCSFCRRAMGDLLELMRSDPKLKVVLKEFPLLGPDSMEAAQVAVAVRMQDSTGKKYLAFHQKLLGGRGSANKARAMAAAKDAGLDIGRLEKDLASAEVRDTIEENFKLAKAMGLSSTPSYVIGKQIIVGAIGINGLRGKVSVARCGQGECKDVGASRQ